MTHGGSYIHIKIYWYPGCHYIANIFSMHALLQSAKWQPAMTLCDKLVNYDMTKD